MLHSLPRDRDRHKPSDSIKYSVTKVFNLTLLLLHNKEGRGLFRMGGGPLTLCPPPLNTCCMWLLMSLCPSATVIDI